MSDHSEIDPCLVQSFNEAIGEDAATSTKYENGPIFDPASKVTWFEVTSLTNPAEAVTLGVGGQDEVTGVFQIDIYVPLNTSTKATNEAVKKLNNFFAIGKSIQYGSTVLKIMRCGKSGPSGESQGYYKTTVSVFWKTRLQRSN